MQWAEPWFGVTTDFDLYIINIASTDSVTGISQNVNATTQKPFEFASFTAGNTSALQLPDRHRPDAGHRDAADQVGQLRQRSRLDQRASSTRSRPAATRSGRRSSATTASADAQTVGAVPFSDSSVVEPYSSRGPVTHLFGPVAGVTPAAALGSPQVISKPDVVATDAAQNTFFGTNVGGGLFRFFGTSQASPHAAGVAALQLSAEPSLRQAEVKSNQKSTAVPVGSGGPLVAGSGLIDARGGPDRRRSTLRRRYDQEEAPPRRRSRRRRSSRSPSEPGATLACTSTGGRPRTVLGPADVQGQAGQAQADRFRPPTSPAT